MEASHPKKKGLSFLNVAMRVVICTLLLAVGVIGMQGLASLKKPPAEAEVRERAIKVDTVTVDLADVPVWINGYGQARALNTVALAPEVSGVVVHRHDRLKAGERVRRGEVLFRIDERNYRAAVDEARALADQLENGIQRLRQQQQIDTRRIDTLKRNRDLAQAEYDRVRSLLESDSIGTRSKVDQVEQALNGATDLLDQLSQAVSLYPIRIKESQSSLQSARARLSLAGTNLKRCTVTAPFDGRVKTAAVEQGQFVSPGQALVTLADDAVLEIQVPLDSRDARRWLRFRPDPAGTRGAWFGPLEPVDCRIRWTETDQAQTWQGQLHRVVRFDEKTRTLTVAVRVQAAAAVRIAGTGLPLVEGMFCQVSIPGRILHQVARLPRLAVSFTDTVYTAVDNRLQTVTVTVAHAEGDWAYVSAGLAQGAQVIVTRLVDPLENALLNITATEEIIATEEIAPTEEITSTEEIAPTEEITSTEEKRS